MFLLAMHLCLMKGKLASANFPLGRIIIVWSQGFEISRIVGFLTCNSSTSLCIRCLLEAKLVVSIFPSGRFISMNLLVWCCCWQCYLSFRKKHKYETIVMAFVTRKIDSMSTFTTIMVLEVHHIIISHLEYLQKIHFYIINVELFHATSIATHFNASFSPASSFLLTGVKIPRNKGGHFPLLKSKLDSRTFGMAGLTGLLTRYHLSKIWIN